MQEQKFPEDDPLYKMVWETQPALQHLEIHANRARADLEWKAKHNRDDGIRRTAAHSELPQPHD